jgi:putative protease
VKKDEQHPELLAPAGGWDCLRAAVANGADAVYFGLPRFNARLRADNFRDEELAEVVTFCHRHGVKAYVAFNTLVFTGELDAAEQMLRDCSRAGVDALIVQDVGLVRLARKVVPELPIHASTQMTITSPEGVEFARDIGVERVVLARELSLRELEKFNDETRMTNAEGDEHPSSVIRHSALPLEVFVHGALCVAYSGQCLTSESLGQRSANRGECAQACRMTYELIVDGEVRDLGDRKYLLSPQDLAAVDQIPALLECGVTSFKIEGRLKSPEYVAGVCQVYRRAIDDAIAQREHRTTEAERYQLEMTFSRGLFSGWMHGVNHQRLVPARSGKKRGPLAGVIARVGGESVEFETSVALKPGDGIVFDTGGDTDSEQGGRIYEIKGRRYYFEHDRIDFSKLKPGDRVWKTDDPALNKRLQQSYSGRIEPRRRTAFTLTVRGGTGDSMTAEAVCGDGTKVAVHSAIPLQAARTAPLGDEKLREHLGRFGEHPYEVSELRNELTGAVILPIGEMNRMRRQLASALDEALERKRAESEQTWRGFFHSREDRSAAVEESRTQISKSNISLPVLCRSMEQIEAALGCGVAMLHVDFEDIRRYKDAVALVRQCGKDLQPVAGGSGRGNRGQSDAPWQTRAGDRLEACPTIFLATPRIQKAGEQGFFKLIENAAPDGVLIRNLGAIDYFRATPLRCIGDFSLNVANPLTAQHFIACGLERVTISYDLNIEQVLGLLDAAPPSWFEITLHQHIPMFHMEHCVFAAFMSKGTSFLDCGRPCDTHRVHLRDRVGIQHPLRADVGCRNTLFNAVPQTGAGFFDVLRAAGLSHFRVELLEEDAAESARVIRAYQSLLAGERDGEGLWRELKAQSQLGVTKGTLEPK